MHNVSWPLIEQSLECLLDSIRGRERKTAETIAAKTIDKLYDALSPFGVFDKAQRITGEPAASDLIPSLLVARACIIDEWFEEAERKTLNALRIISGFRKQDPAIETGWVPE